ncbi:DUF202 domain-containing protein [Phenylobacterium sp.]|uniref:YidH family protein n=1 Tax=Phenylobacterium sp. TaxID=1871053 RepID=UPI0028A0EDFE|nr:DUF202 domain-containing protein [Phenylobacterium sp.]
MASRLPKGPPRPKRVENPPLPPLPDVEGMSADGASVTYSTHRTRLSTHRTELSEHRTDLSEYRTDLSTERTEMSMRRTGMSFQRTRMSDDRTLMSVIRTSLSLIGFGFTIYQAFEKLREAGAIASAAAPRNFGVTLVMLGILMLLIGMIRHVRFMRELSQTRAAMAKEGLVFAESRFPVSSTFWIAVALLLLGFAAIAAMVFRVAIFG